MILRAATAQDFGFIRALVQQPENRLYLTDEDEAALAAYLADPASRLLIWETGPGTRGGFALFCNIGGASGAVELRRLALSEVGLGRGAGFVGALVAHAFETLGAARVWLDASGENLRAQRVYERLGFTLEGRLRQQIYCAPLARTVDELFYGMMRSEWLAASPLAAPQP